MTIMIGSPNSDSVVVSVFLFFLLIFNIQSLKPCLCTTNITNSSVSGSSICRETEKQALLSFKESVKDTDNILSSWRNDSHTDCCMWERVVCSSLTGHVLELHLQNDEYLFSYQGIKGGNLHPSLLNLTELRYLNLSGNHYFGGTIPSFIGSFRSLEQLDLSKAGFYGAIPPTIGNLSSLRTLKLGSTLLYYSVQQIYAERLDCLSGLLHLEHLDFSHVNLSRVPTANWVQVINSLPSLVELHFSGCNLNFLGKTDDVFVNVSNSLAILDLSANNPRQLSSHFLVPSSAVLRWIFELSKLTSLDLSFNSIIAPIPTRANFTTTIKRIDLSFNNFNSTLPDWLYSCNHLESLISIFSYLNGTIYNAIGNLTSLRILDLSSNKLSGEIPIEIGKLCGLESLALSGNKLQGAWPFRRSESDCLGRKALQVLDLSENQISGHLPDNIEQFKSLRSLYLNNNSLSGPIPDSIGKLSSLKYLLISQNNFTGKLPESFGQLFNLISVDISTNSLDGVVNERHFANLSKLSNLRASGNHPTLKVDPKWIPPFRLRALELGLWNVMADTPSCPAWLEAQRDSLQYLNLSNTGISFQIPDWVWNISFLLDLSYNKHHGTIPYLGSPQFIYLNSNQFSGPLPAILKKYDIEVLDLSKNAFSGGLSSFLCNTSYDYLKILHLQGNMLSGELPDCWTNVPLLELLNLENNNFSGNIPNSIGALMSLFSLNLSNNSLSGPMPSSMQNCPFLFKLDLSHNKFSGNIPPWMGLHFIIMRILILRSNKFDGEISPNICHLSSLQIFDLSDNNFSGMIPLCVGNFTAMKTSTDLFGNSFIYNIPIFGNHFPESASIKTKGTESIYESILPLVKSIDLSMNNFSGEIPKTITNLVELQTLNLSRNRFTGMIPDGVGDMKGLESLDLSKNCLSGEIPHNFIALSSLSYLNLSYNNLTGLIPQGGQLQTLSELGFIGNKLCGRPLSTDCRPTPDHPRYNDGNHEGGKPHVDWFYVLLSSGYAVGFSLVISMLIFNKLWRDAYFGFLEHIWDKLYVCVRIRFRNA